MARKKVLFLAHRIPYPPNKGDKIRSYRIFECLRERFDVHLAAFVDDPNDFQYQEYLKERAASLALIPIDRTRRTAMSVTGLASREPLSVAFYRSQAMARAVDVMRTRPLSGEIAFSSTVAQYLTKWRPGRPRVMDLCDADSVKWDDYAERKRAPMSMVYRREAAQLAAIEREVIRNFDLTFAISRAEADLLEGAAGAPVDWFGNGVDTDFFDPRRYTPAAEGLTSSPENTPKPDGFDVVFTGAMDYWANTDAALWFLDSIWPLIRTRQPVARVAFVGANPAPSLRARDGLNGVTVTGRVGDIRPYLFSAGVCVAPMRIARGIQNKVLEAMSAGRPVVATHSAAIGIDIANGEHYLEADEPQQFADAVLGLLAEPDRANALGAAARAHMVDSYQWSSQLARFEAGLARIGLID